MNFTRIKRVAALAVVVVLAMPLIARAVDTNSPQPANKATARGAKDVTFGPGTNVELLSATLKTSKPTDLILQVSMECSILTNVFIAGDDEGGASQTQSTNGRVRVWVEVDGKIVAINAASTPPQDPAAQPAGTEADKVTFCDRTHARTVTDREDPLDGIDEQRDYQRTKSANAFNWLRFNAGSGVHTVVVKADLVVSPKECAAVASEPAISPAEEPLGETCAEAYVGNRTLIIEPTKTANNAVM